nr:MAG TPA: hypothetical protein [Caudoviricetes sp.]
MGPTQWRALRKHPRRNARLSVARAPRRLRRDRLRRFVYSSVAYGTKVTATNTANKQLQTRAKRCNHAKYTDTIPCCKGGKCDDTHQYCSNTNGCFCPSAPVANKQPTCVESKLEANKMNSRLTETVRDRRRDGRHHTPPTHTALQPSETH